MNEFETRARAAGRAVRDAVRDTHPLAATELTPPRRRSSARALLIAAAAVLAVAIIGTSLIGPNDPPSAAEVAAFCDTVRRGATDANDQTAHLQRMLQLAPDEFKDDITVLAKWAEDLSKATTEQRKEFEASSERLSAWAGVECYPDAAQPNADAAQQRFAPSALPEGTKICFVLNELPRSPSRATNDTITIYGDSTLPDPYAGPLLATATSTNGLLVNSEREAQPVAVIGHPDAVSGQIAGTNGNALATGTGIQWQIPVSGATSVGILARGEPIESQLPDLAAHVIQSDSDARLDDAYLPPNFTVLHSGPMEPIRDPLNIRLGITFEVNAAENGTALVDSASAGVAWNGTVLTDQAFQATRFFAENAANRTIAGKPALIWDVSGSEQDHESLARWKESDNVTISAGAFGGDRASRRQDLEALIATMHRLDRTEWVNLVRQFSYCGSLSRISHTSSESKTSSGTTLIDATTSTSSPGSTATTSGPVGP